ncbi:MAG: DMT family transporter [Pseudomonadota bacterium]
MVFSNHLRLYGLFAAMGIAMLWSGWIVLSRMGVTRDFSVSDIMLVRYATAAIVALPLAFLWWPRHLAWWKIILLSITGAGVGYAGVSYAGMRFAPASHIGIVMNGSLPIIVLLINAVLAKIRPSGWQWLFCLLIPLGFFIILADRQFESSPLDLMTGYGLLLLASIQFGWYMVAGYQWGITPRQLVACVPLVNGILAVLIWFAFPGNLHQIARSEILLQAAYQGLGPSLIGVYLFYVANIYLGRQRTSAVMASVPVITTLLAIPILGEQPGLPTWIGMAVATSALLALIFCSKSQDA